MIYCHFSSYRGPGTYKIPSFNDVPSDFRVTLLDKAVNPFCIHSSKAIGEPPFFLAAAAFFAVRHAVNACRADNGETGYYPLQMPATSERIRMACADPISKDIARTSEFQAKGSY